MAQKYNSKIKQQPRFDESIMNEQLINTRQTFFARDPGFVVVLDRGLGAACGGQSVQVIQETNGTPTFVVAALVAVFAAGAFFAGAFLVAAAFALDAAVVPVTAFAISQQDESSSASGNRTFFAGARFDAVVVFFVAGVAFALPARTFLGAAVFFVVAVVDLAADLAAGLAAALVAGFAAGLEAGFLVVVVVDLGLATVLEGGLEF